MSGMQLCCHCNPEAAAGPHDALYLFDRFLRSMQA